MIREREFSDGPGGSASARRAPGSTSLFSETLEPPFYTTQLLAKAKKKMILCLERGEPAGLGARALGGAPRGCAKRPLSPCRLRRRKTMLAPPPSRCSHHPMMDSWGCLLILFGLVFRWRSCSSIVTSSSAKVVFSEIRSRFKNMAAWTID